MTLINADTRLATGARDRPIPWLIGALAFTTLLFVPALIWAGKAWVGNERYTHGFLLLGVCVAIAWRNLRHAPTSAEGPDSRGLALAVTGLTLHVIGYLAREPVLSVFAFPFAVLGIVAFIHSSDVARRLAVPLLIPLAAVPNPVATAIGDRLQTMSASSAAALLGGGSPNGNTLAHGGFLFDVEPLCSGMGGFLVLLATALVLLHVTGASPRRWILLVLATIPLALAGNTLRIVGTVLATSRWGPDVGLGTTHEILGAITFLVGFAGLAVLATIRNTRKGGATLG